MGKTESAIQWMENHANDNNDMVTTRGIAGVREETLTAPRQ
jgi:hypothetical protein